MTGRRTDKSKASGRGKKRPAAGKRAGKSRPSSREQRLLAKIAQLTAKLAAKDAGAKGSAAGDLNLQADRGSVAAGAVKDSLVNTGQIQGDVYLGRPASNAKEALAIYRRVLISRHRHVLLRGIVPPSADGKASERRPELAQVYVALDTTSVERPPETRAKKRAAAPRVESKPLSALAAAVRNRRMVLLGDPGSGKSTFVAHLGLCLAAHALSPEKGWLRKLPGWPKAEATLVPVCVVLRDFARSPALRAHSGEPSPKPLWDFFLAQLERQNLGFAAEPIEEALEGGKALVILDGLDEIPGAEERAKVCDAVNAFAARYPRCRLIATCRTLSYQPGPGCPRLGDLPAFELAPFDQEKIDAFIAAWYAELGHLGEVKSEDVARKTSALQAAVRRPDIRRLAPSPLLLAVMAAFHAHRGRLPDQRAQLYEETINLLLWNWEQARTSDSAETPLLRQLLLEAGTKDADLYRALARRAFLVHQHGGGEDDGPADIAEKDLEKDLTALHPKGSKDWATKVIEAIRLRAGLLVERTEGVFAFPHRTFQEYLAGAHLAGMGNFATEAAGLAKRDVSLSREVLLLAAGKQAHVNKEVDRPLHLVDVLCPTGTSDTVEAWRLASLAGEIVIEIGVDAARNGAGGSDLCQRVRERLVVLVEGEKLPARERATAGDVLAAIGDPRFRDSSEGCLPADDMLGFVEIPAGPFLMGSDKARDTEASGDEQPQHRVGLPEFLMARFPVTVAQFRAFVQATDTKLEDESGLGQPATRPMTYVSLDKAQEYCAWLDGLLRSRPGLPAELRQALDRGKVTLPSETEWEKAARGTDGRIYPWGDEWKQEAANVWDTGIRSTSPVGCFPAGRSPDGCLDMAGNVWEWTRSRYAPYPYPPDVKARARRETPGGDDFRVVRGASFYNFQWDARAAFRNYSRPASRDLDVGIRVVVSPSVSDL